MHSSERPPVRALWTGEVPCFDSCLPDRNFGSVFRYAFDVCHPPPVNQGGMTACTYETGSQKSPVLRRISINHTKRVRSQAADDLQVTFKCRIHRCEVALTTQAQPQLRETPARNGIPINGIGISQAPLKSRFRIGIRCRAWPAVHC